MKKILLFPLLLFAFMINANAQCVADFTAVTYGSKVHLTNTSSTPDPNFTYYMWNFGDGNFFHQKDPVWHQYSSLGTYNINLFVFDSLSNCSNNITKQVTIECIADVNYTIQGYTVDFTGIIQTNATVTNYLWSFGDGTGSAQQNPQHTYNAPGTYLAAFGFETSTNCWDSVTFTIVIPPVSCGADFSFNITGDTVSFTDQSTFTSTSNNNYIWNFGDGHSSTQQNPNHNYIAPGTYNVTLTIWDSNCADSIMKQVVVPCQVQTDFTYTVNNNTVDFSGIVNTNTNVLYSWSFGDGNFSSHLNPQHTYNTHGTYLVTFEAYESNWQCWDSLSKWVTIAPPACMASFNHTASGLLVTFQNNSTPANHTIYNWSFGDGHSSSQQNPVHNYTASGSYWVILSIHDTLNNCFDSTSLQITVTATPCNASFSHSISGLSVHTHNTSTGSLTSTLFSWNFGDGNTASGYNVIHTYAAAGTYTVTLTMHDTINNCIDSAQAQVTVHVPCVAGFTKSVNNNVVTFTNTSTGTTGSTHYFWNFGDNHSSNQQNPVHTYQNTGYYLISLTLIDSNTNCYSTAYDSVYISNVPSVYTLSGSVIMGNTHADAGHVWLIVYDSIAGTLTAIDSVLIGSGGSYHFSGVSAGYYLIKAALSSGSSQYYNYMPTYYTDKLLWSDANLLLVTNNVSNRDITLIAGSNPGGPGFIGGLVSQGANKKGAPGDPLEGILVLLLNQDKTPVAMDYTDSEGKYGFDNLAFGTYLVWGEIPGKETFPATVTISSQNPSVNNINLDVNTYSIDVNVGIWKTPAANSNISVYPNPVVNKAVIDFNNLVTDKITIEVVDLTGRVVYTTQTGVETSTAEVDLSGINKGFYLLNIYSNNEIIKVQKLVKE